MRRFSRLRLRSSFFIPLLGGALLFSQAHAAATCSGMPSSQLQIFDIKAPAVQTIVVPAEQLEKPDRDEDDLASRHSLMLSEVRIVTWFEIMHRIIAGSDGQICDAPTMVRIGFGLDRRAVILARRAAEDGCLPGAMLEHEVAHARALDRGVDEFIERRTPEITRGVIALKETPAPDPELARARWQAGLRAIVMESRRELFEDLRTANTTIDRATAIENACDGRLRKLQSRQD